MRDSISFQDIFKNNFLKSQEFEGVTLSQILIALAFAFAAGLFIYLIYRAANHSSMFVNSFAVSLVALTMITSLVIMTITSNVLLSLGMVGALSIIRFRTAVKEAIDIVYMFWAVAVGITVGAGFYFIASIGTIAIGLILFVMSRITTSNDAFVLVISAQNSGAQADVEKLLKSRGAKYLFKASASNSEATEITYEIRLRKNQSDLTRELNQLQGIEAVSLVGFKTQNYF